MPLRLIVIATFFFASPALSAEDLDAALSELATEVLSYFESGPPKKIAIATMVHGDGTCSDLSERASDKFQGELFRAKSPETSVVDRRSLSAIFREQQLVEDGTISPSGAAKIAAVEQVDAIVTGKMTQYGDDLEFVVSMLDAVSGTVIGFADSAFRLSSRDEKMLDSKNLARCGFASAKSGTGSNNVADALESQTPQSSSVIEASRFFSSDVYDAQVSTLVYSKSTGLVSFAVRFKNTTENPIAVSYIPNSMFGSDDAGNQLQYAGQITGVRTCYSANQLEYCNSSRAEYATVIPAGKGAQLNYQMQGVKGADDLKVTLGFELVVTPDTNNTDDYESQSVGFFDISASGS